MDLKAFVHVVDEPDQEKNYTSDELLNLGVTEVASGLASKETNTIGKESTGFVQAPTGLSAPLPSHCAVCGSSFSSGWNGKEWVAFDARILADTKVNAAGSILVHTGCYASIESSVTALLSFDEM